MQQALIKDGVVVNLVEISDGKTTLWEPPEGHTVVPAGSARIGDAYDGKSFSRPPESQESMFAHAASRRGDAGHAFHIIDGMTVSVDQRDHPLIARLAERAKRDSTLVIELTMRREGKVIALNASQIVALNEALTDHYIAGLRAQAGVTKGISDGSITDHTGVDRPPAPLPQWPQRFFEPAK